MYSEGEEPSRPAPSPRRDTTRWRRALWWTVAIVILLMASAYAIGGRSVLRRLLQFRSQAAAVLQPPTAADMRNATDTATAAEAKRVGGTPLVHMMIWIGSVFAFVGLVFVVSSRRRRE